MLELEHGFRVTDVHVCLEPDVDRRRDAGRGDPETIEREMNQAGVVRSVVFPGPRDGSYLKANNAVARQCVERPFVAFARINGPLTPGDRVTSRLRNVRSSRTTDHTSPNDVEQYAYDDRFVGFKIHPARDGIPDPDVLDRLEAVELPLLVHGGTEVPPKTIAETLLVYDVPVIIAHAGGYPLNRDLMNQAIDLLEVHDSLYLDLSYVPFRDVLERAVKEHPDRVLFGSGAPNTHPDVAVMTVLSLDVPEDSMKKVFSKNPSRVVPELSP
jgi:hypothetical protein